MPDPRHNAACPRCKGEGFYLKHEGKGYYPDDSFGHNVWEDCTCSAEDAHVATVRADMPKASSRHAGWFDKQED